MSKVVKSWVGTSVKVVLTFGALGALSAWQFTTELPSPSAAEPPHAAPHEPAPKAPPAAKPAPKAPDTKPAAKPSSDDKRAEKPASPMVNPKTAEPRPDPAHDAEAPITPEQALTLLQDGNERWTSGNPQDPNIDSARRESLAESGQTPFAIVLTCSDSRVPPERLFDRGVGDIFVIRVAGNVAGPHESGSIEYAVEHLGSPVLIVLGHTKCGAVAAAAAGAPVEGNVASLVEAIEPAVERAHKANPNLEGKDLVPAAVRENVWQSVCDLLRNSKPCREAVSQKKLRVIGAVYDIGSGTVDWLGEHPWQAELIAAYSAPAPTASETAHADEQPARPDDH